MNLSIAINYNPFNINNLKQNKMTKQEVSNRVSKNGKALALDLFCWDEKTNTFSSEESGLVLDFKGVNYCTFDTGSECTFKTGSSCTFNTGSSCTFDTGNNCTFKTGIYCTFDTGWNCTFKTGWNCTFTTESECTFDTGSDCTFKTGGSCTFNTGSNCTFDTEWNCTFKTGDSCTFNTGSNCVIVRRDIFEVIQPKADVKIKLNEWGVKGFTKVKETKTITIDGKDIEISIKSFEELKKQLTK